MALTDAACRTAKATGDRLKLHDTSGLFLHVTPKGTKTWRVDYAFEGKRRTATLGRYPAMKLAEAREARDQLKGSLGDGTDPTKPDEVLTFEVVAKQWFDANRSKWASAYSSRLWSRVELNLLPTLGAKPVAEIRPRDVLETLRTVEARGVVYSAKRIRGIVASIYRYAIAGDMAADIGDALQHLPRVEHRAALRDSDLPEFFKRLDAYDGGEVTKLGLEIVMHTFVRTSEIRFAKWSEIEVDVWRIGGSRMKMGRDHIIPLSRQVRNMLDELREAGGGSEWLLPGSLRHSAKPVSENTMLYALRNMGYHKKATVHGFRGTASTILNESGLFNSDWIERQLAHVPGDQVRSAYNAAEWMEQRKKMMQWYSDFLDKKRDNNQISFNDLLV